MQKLAIVLPLLVGGWFVGFGALPLLLVLALIGVGIALDDELEFLGICMPTVRVIFDGGDMRPAGMTGVPIDIGVAEER